ncbi:hypothetical protein OH77DRAFT_522480 [Trametes cingulata]|nr:hypothetical protein OH77DRAFT_522480 [Trametes cingulata]
MATALADRKNPLLEVPSRACHAETRVMYSPPSTWVVSGVSCYFGRALSGTAVGRANSATSSGVPTRKTSYCHTSVSATQVPHVVLLSRFTSSRSRSLGPQTLADRLKMPAQTRTGRDSVQDAGASMCCRRCRARLDGACGRHRLSKKLKLKLKLCTPPHSLAIRLLGVSMAWRTPQGVQEPGRVSLPVLLAADAIRQCYVRHKPCGHATNLNPLAAFSAQKSVAHESTSVER